jgi:predicted dinucleotide-binding enzyme
LKGFVVNLGIVGTGNLAVALGRAWAGAGHRLVVAGRERTRANAAADEIGQRARSADLSELAYHVDAVIVAVAWEGLENALVLAGGPEGSLAGKTVIDCTNPVDFTTGRLKLSTGSAAELVARTAHGANVVKALLLYAGTSWPYVGPDSGRPVVPICGDEHASLETARALIADLGASAAVVGDLGSARQLEEAAGMVIRLVATSHNPRLAVPDVART